MGKIQQHKWRLRNKQKNLGRLGWGSLLIKEIDQKLDLMQV
jgi:hypothetical protein